MTPQQRPDSADAAPVGTTAKVIPFGGPLAVDTSVAKRFLQVLASDDGPWHFQTFSDQRESDAKRLIRSFPATADGLDLALTTLAGLNAQGAGVFVAVNRMSGDQRSAQATASIRAFFVDLDGAPLAPVAGWLPPHAVVQSSPGRWHAYWRVADCPVERFKPVQQALARRFGGDAAVCDPPRVMRLPGFQHRKGVPTPTLLLSADERLPPYTLAQIEAALRASADGEVAKPEPARGEEGSTNGFRKSFEGLSVTLLSVGNELTFPASCWPTDVGQREKALFAFVRRLRAVLPLETPDAEQRHYARWWFDRCSHVVGTKDFAVTLGAFKRAWKAVRTPMQAEGEQRAAVIERMAVFEPPARIRDLDYGDRFEALYRLLCAQDENQRAHHAGRPFPLSARVAAEVLGIDRQTASVLLVEMRACGAIELAERGNKGALKAHRYRLLVRPDGSPTAAEEQQ